MSERGSFVTEYVYCKKCFEVLKKHLLKVQDKWLYGNVIKITEIESRENEYPIIAGKIGDSSSGGEMITFMHNTGDDIEKELCHPVAIAIISESQANRGIINLYPKGWHGERIKEQA